MKIKTEILKGYIADIVCNQISDFEFDENMMLSLRATEILSEIQNILHSGNEQSDFEMIEQIISVFDKYHLDCGGCHDF